MASDACTLTEGDIPLLVSFPHAGTDIPDSIARRMTPAALMRADTDWHLPTLYAFVSQLGASTLVPNYSRYVIDLNRPPDDNNLYPGQDTTGLVPPALEYDHSYGCSIIGGFVSRGSASPPLDGQYFFSDYCQGWLRSITYQNGRITSRTVWNVPRLGQVLSFGEDAAGEIYVLSDNGNVYRISEQ